MLGSPSTSSATPATDGSARALPDDLEREFAQSAARVFREACRNARLRDRRHVLQSDYLELLVGAMRDCLQTAISSELSSHNAAILSGCQMPDELWCEIWEHLPMRDRIAVSQVCANWRALALRTPRIWSRLDFISTRHHEECECDTCIAIDYELTCSSCLKPYTRGRSNIASIACILSRSARSPVTVHLHFDSRAGLVDPSPAEELAKILSPHSDRLVEIHIVVDDEYGGYVPRTFLGGLPRMLPALHTITCNIAGSPFEKDSFGLLCRQVFWPSVQFIDHHDALFDEPQEESNFTSLLPSVRTLSTTFLSALQLQTSLTACGQLTKMSLCLSCPDGFDALLACPRIKSLSQHILFFKLYDLSLRDEEAALTMFHHQGSRELVIEYAEGETMEKGLAILADLRGNVSLSLTQNDKGQAVLTAVDDRDFKREIRSTRFLVRRTWHHLPPASIVSLTFDTQLWQQHWVALPTLASVQHLTFILSHPFAELGVDAKAAWLVFPTLLPGLETIRLVGSGLISTVVATSDLAFLVSKLRGGVRLRATILDYVVLEGEPEALLGTLETQRTMREA